MLVVRELPLVHLCRAASASAATASCQPPAHLPTPNRGGGHVPHSCYTLILWMEHHTEPTAPAGPASREGSKCCFGMAAGEPVLRS